MHRIEASFDYHSIIMNCFIRKKISLEIVKVKKTKEEMLRENIQSAKNQTFLTFLASMFMAPRPPFADRMPRASSVLQQSKVRTY